EGMPVSVDVLAGNTPAMTTLLAQSPQVAQRFGGARGTCVGDRGMLKSPQMAAPAGLHDISALPKPQVERLLKAQVLDLALFTAQVCEGEPQAIRYMVRRNPLRAEEVAAVRRDKQRSRAQWVAKQNASLAAQPRAQAAGALRECHTKLIRLKIDAGLPGD